MRKPWYLRVLEARRAAAKIARAELAGALSAQARSQTSTFWVSGSRPEGGQGARRAIAADALLLEEGRRAAERRVAAARLQVREARQACVGLELLARRRLEALAKRALRGEAAELDERNRMPGTWPP